MPLFKCCLHSVWYCASAAIRETGLLFQVLWLYIHVQVHFIWVSGKLQMQGGASWSRCCLCPTHESCSSGFRRGSHAAYREEGLLFQMLSLLNDPQEERQAQAAQQQAGQP